MSSGGGKKRRAKFAIGKIELSTPPPPTSPHATLLAFSLPRPRPTTSRDPFRPRHQLPPGGLQREACTLRWCEFDTRSCVLCGLAENGSQYVHNKIYTEMSTLTRTLVSTSSFSRCRENAHPRGIQAFSCIYVCVRTLAGIQVRRSGVLST